MANNTEQRSYDTGASEGAQSNFEQVASRLESLISQRDTDVRNAMAQYQADGVSEELDNFPGGKRLAKILQKFLPKVLLR